MGNRKSETLEVINKLSKWIRRRSVRERVTMGAIVALILLFLMKVFVKDVVYFFYASQVAHSIGIFVLIYKLTISKTCSGQSSCLNSFPFFVASLSCSISLQLYVPHEMLVSSSGLDYNVTVKPSYILKESKN